MRVAILFTDGVGVGPRDPNTNPLARDEYLLSQFDDGSGTKLPATGTRIDVDTTFGIAGRPQSASNQTAIFTGQPAPQLIGKHVLGYPNAPLREILAAHSIVRALREAGRSVTFLNSFPLAYLDALQLRHAESADDGIVIPERYAKRMKASASTLAFAAADAEFRTIAGNGLTHDLKRVPPLESAARFWNLAADFTLFEHFLADESGHAQDFDAARDALSRFDTFARAVIAARPVDAHVIIVSDHGNVEDLSTRSHTHNRVAVLHFGDTTPPPMRTVADVGSATLTLLGVQR
jgi:hypothetical protein